MGGLPRGFCETRDCGVNDLSKYGVGNWARGGDISRRISLMKTDNKASIFVASCIVGNLLPIAEAISYSDRPYYDSAFYAMAYDVAGLNLRNIKKLQDPKYPLDIVYASVGDRRVWAIKDSLNIDSIALPLLIRIAQSPKSTETKVMQVLSNRRT